MSTKIKSNYKSKSGKQVEKDVLMRAFRLMATAKTMTETYENNFKTVSKYVHATSRGHEAIQIAMGLLLQPQDFVAPYYRDDALLLSIGLRPHDLMLQLFAKRSDPFSGGRSYYSHPSLKDSDKPTIPHQSSATGMQAIPMTGVAMGIQYKEKTNLSTFDAAKNPIAVCCFGDASVTEGEVAEAFQMAALRQLPILYLVEDNGWDISASAKEFRAQDAADYAKGFHGIEVVRLEGNDFENCYYELTKIVETMRRERRPFLVHARVPLLNHHTSGVRKEWYRDDLADHIARDPYPILKNTLLKNNISETDIQKIEAEAKTTVEADFAEAQLAENPIPSDLFQHDFAPTPILEESDGKTPPPSIKAPETVVMVDCALHAMEELMRKHPECLFYGQDVGRRLGGVFREAATLAEKFGDERVFNTPIQEAFIVGSTVGMSAVGLKPIVEVQFADYLFPGFNQLFTEVARSCYLSNGKFPVSMVLRVPIGAYGSGGPYHSSSVETFVTAIRGLKVAYPSNGADLKGLLKAAYYDPNPCVIFEHKGLYWSKVKGTETARVVEPTENYVLPFGKANIVWRLSDENIKKGNTLVVVTYGMGVHWALNAIQDDAILGGAVEILDLRTLAPLDEKMVFERVRVHGKCLVLTEEQSSPSFAQSLVGNIQENCFEQLDAPVRLLGAENLPAIPLNEILEKTMLPNSEKVRAAIEKLLKY
ncbi:MAG: hypothetical protein RL757_582 [Bacteroidota bacterium]|jgi:2-oxoisovalerate dehydrogenase E1 component